MKKTLVPIASLISTLVFSQLAIDSTQSKEKEIEAVTIVAKKPTVESKVDRTIFNVANSSILAGNTSWDVLRMTPLVSVDNDEDLKAEGEAVTVYINDRKSVFTGKELKEYLQTIPADNLMKIEVITSPSSRYETTGSVINIVLKKLDNEGIKGNVTFKNTQNTKNSQYTNFNLNYHKKNFTQTFMGSYTDYTWIQRNFFSNTIYQNTIYTEGNTKNTYKGESPSVSSTSEYEINKKNTLGIILELYHNKDINSSDSESTQYISNAYNYKRNQNQFASNLNSTFGTNLFYKYYDKEKNKILDLNLGSNYRGESKTNHFLRNTIYDNNTENQEIGIRSDVETRNYYFKIDYTQALGKSGGNLEVGGKTEFNNNIVPNHLYGDFLEGLNTKDIYHYEDNINSTYANYSKTFFEKLETRFGVRYEHITYKVRQDAEEISRKDSYGIFLPNVLLKYSFSNQYDLSFTYNRNITRPRYSSFNTFLQPTNEGLYTRGNMNLIPNTVDRLNIKFGFLKKYFISARYTYANQDYFPSDVIEGDKIISGLNNFYGKIHKYYLYANTNQTFFKNKLNVNLSFGWNYNNNRDFNIKNNLKSANYANYWTGSTNLTYTNLFNKNLNLSAWVEIYNQNDGNFYANKTNVFHTISATKIFPKTQMEVSLQLINIFKRPDFDFTTFSEYGVRTNSVRSDWYGFSLAFVKRFGNQKVKANTKTDIEKINNSEK